MEQKETIEFWKKALLPQPKGKRWAPGEELNYSKDWLYNSAKQLFKWAVGTEVTQEEFEKALESAASHFVR